MNLKLAFSTCPNDTFMFDGLVHQRIDTKGYSFDVEMADIEELNLQASQGENDITKISFNAFAQYTQQYQMLTSGAALGFGNGPLVISKHKIYPDELHDVKIGIPGEKTTANLLLNILFPNVQNKKVYLFSDIEDAVLGCEIDAGLIIHESRFSYKKKGLKKVVDMGELWAKEKKLPLPLGGIAIKRDLDDAVKTDIQDLIADSVDFALKNPKISYEFVKKHARELDDSVISRHIDLYVNRYSINCQSDGREAIEFLVGEAAVLNQKPLHKSIFIK